MPPSIKILLPRSTNTLYFSLLFGDNVYMLNGGRQLYLSLIRMLFGAKGPTYMYACSNLITRTIVFQLPLSYWTLSDQPIRGKYMSHGRLQMCISGL